MFEVLEKRQLAENIILMNVHAPRVARAARPGQFVIVRADHNGERIPLTISDYDPTEGWVSIVTQVVGMSTRKICATEVGASLADMAGPLGRPSEFVHLPERELAARRMLFIAGGVGAAPVYAQVKWLAGHGNPPDVIVGARNSSMLIMRERLSIAASDLHVATDDGSEGFHGLVTDLMRDLLDNRGKRYDEVVAIGPMAMMKFVARATLPYGIPTTVSLNTLMVDGTGMCGACRVSVGGQTRFACVDGPEFDGHAVDFDEAIRRQGMYRTLEERAARIEAERAAGHNCRIGLG